MSPLVLVLCILVALQLNAIASGIVCGLLAVWQRRRLLARIKARHPQWADVDMSESDYSLKVYPVSDKRKAAN